MSDFREHLNEKLNDPAFQKEWEALDLRYAVIEQLIRLRNTYGLSQAQLAEKLNTTQAVSAASKTAPSISASTLLTVWLGRLASGWN